jgi:hypothetical protein
MARESITISERSCDWRYRRRRRKSGDGGVIGSNDGRSRIRKRLGYNPFEDVGRDDVLCRWGHS